MILPDLYELQVVLEKNYKRKKFYGSVRKNKGNKKGEINSDILNTPLYRLYAETNTFETLNLVKPIKMPNRKIIDIYQISKQHANYVKFAKDTLKNVAERMKNIIQKNSLLDWINDKEFVMKNLIRYLIHELIVKIAR